MQHIFHSLKEALKRKSYDKQLLARTLLNELSVFLSHHDVLQGYVKRSTLYVHTHNHQYSILVFTKKKDILTLLNTKLSTLKYDLVLRDIRVVPQRDAVQRNEE